MKRAINAKNNIREPEAFERLGCQNSLPLKRVLLIKGGSDRSEPIYDLARVLGDLGVGVQVVDQDLIASTLKWLLFARKSGALVFVRYYNTDGQFIQRQLHRARFLGCTVSRWWVGSDVLYCRESERAIEAARAIDEAVDLNVAVSPHLVNELSEIGIKAEYIPSFCRVPRSSDDPSLPFPKGVLSYLPTNRRAFYGEEVLSAAIRENPDLHFFVIGDESHSLAHHFNVTSLGWVEDMDAIWPQVGALLRVTEHDGMPRMVLEALARHRYVIYSEVFQGCWLGRSKEEVLQHLEAFKSIDKPNMSGPADLCRSTNAATSFANLLEKHRKKGFFGEPTEEFDICTQASVLN